MTAQTAAPATVTRWVMTDERRSLLLWGLAGASWLVVGAVTLGIYLLLAGFVRRASDTIRCGNDFARRNEDNSPTASCSVIAPWTMRISSIGLFRSA